MAIEQISFPQAKAYSDATDLFGRLADLGNKQSQPSNLAALQQKYLTPPSGADATGLPGSPYAGPVAPNASPPAGGTTAAFSAPPTAPDVNSAIAATAPTAGMDPATWKAVASIESSLEPSSNYSKPTQYKGLFQIGTSEWKDHGGGGDVYSAHDNAAAAASIAKSNNAWFKGQYGRDPTPVETYMMHQQGRGFFLNGTMTNVAGNPYPGMSGPQTPQSFMKGWADEIERRRKHFASEQG